MEFEVQSLNLPKMPLKLYARPTAVGRVAFSQRRRWSIQQKQGPILYHNKIGCVFWRLRITSVSEFISDYTPNLVEALIRQIAFIPKHEAEAATPAQTMTMMIHSDTQHYTTFTYILDMI